MYYQNTNNLKEPTIFDKLYTIYKKDNLVKCMLGKKFIIHPLTFFQVNFGAAELMYIEIEKMIKRQISLKPNKKFVLYDMCCGIGVYSVLFHQYFDECIGIDYNPNNIKIANKMKSINNINNINFFEGKVEDIMEEKFKNDSKEHIMIFNPARSGFSSSILEFIKKRKEYTLLILCKPEILLSLLRHNIGVLLDLKIEMFPKTGNQEYIVEVI
jgi:tRNA/tmRNA/rRNA uracil-C5-methylase (TrmA/RlmC/RlmD family)